MLTLITICLAQTPTLPNNPQSHPIVMHEAAPPMVKEPPVSDPVATTTTLDDATVLKVGRNIGDGLLAVAVLLALLLVKLLFAPAKAPPVRERRRQEYQWDEPGMSEKAAFAHKAKPPLYKAARRSTR